jgi:Prokaryotic membrane lipoprotein lipid attachment site
MKKLLILTVAALMLSGCVVYPGYDYGYYGYGYYDYPYAYGYAGPSVDFVFTNSHGGHFHRGGFRGGSHGGFHGGSHGGFHGGSHGGFRH